MSQISVNLSVNYQSRQKILEAVTLEERYEIIAATMTNEIQVMKISHDLQRRLKVRVDKNQRDYILREQMKLIREELGEESTSDTADEYMKQLEELSGITGSKGQDRQRDQAFPQHEFCCGREQCTEYLH